MPDNVVLNAGAGGETLATDQVPVTLEHIQLIKLVDGTADSVARIPGDAAQGLDVDVTRLPALVAGSANIGDVDVLSVVPGTGATNLGKAIDAVAGATDTGVAPVAVRDDALAALVPIEGDYVPLRADANGALWTHDDALDAALAGAELQVDVVAALPPGANNIGDVDIASPLGAGTEAAAVRVTIATDSTGLVSVDDNAGSLTVDAPVATPVAVRVSDGAAFVDVRGGDVAHDAVDSGNPVKHGAKAVAHGTNPAAVAAADRTDLYANRHGIPFVISGHMNPFTEESVFTTVQTDVALKTVAAGTKIAVTRASVTVDKANSVDVGYRLGFATVTLPATGTGVAGMLSSHPGLAAGSGVVEGNGGGILGIGADDADLRFTCEVPTGGSIRVVVTGFTIES